MATIYRLQPCGMRRRVRWRRAGGWGKIMDALAGAHDAAVQMIDTSIVRMHQPGACITRNRRQYALRQTRGPSLYPARIDTAVARVNEFTP